MNTIVEKPSPQRAQRTQRKLLKLFAFAFLSFYLRVSAVYIFIN